MTTICDLLEWFYAFFTEIFRFKYTCLSKKVTPSKNNKAFWNSTKPCPPTSCLPGCHVTSKYKYMLLEILFRLLELNFIRGHLRM